MVLIDTSIWIDHLRSGGGELERLMRTNRIFTHEFIIGELACGSLKNRTTLLNYLGNLPRCVRASHEEVLHLIDRYKLCSRGIGYIDVALLASSMISNIPLLTKDKKLALIAGELGQMFNVPTKN